MKAIAFIGVAAAIIAAVAAVHHLPTLKNWQMAQRLSKAMPYTAQPPPQMTSANGWRMRV